MKKYLLIEVVIAKISYIIITGNIIQTDVYSNCRYIEKGKQ